MFRLHATAVVDLSMQHLQLQEGQMTSFEKEIENLPTGKYVIGDNAYVCTEHLLTPFPGDAKKKVFNDSYNFHISQCRIRIEMTFGRFTNKWRLFRQPLEVKLENIGPLFLCATRLHNFCINQKILEEGETLLVACHTDGQPGNVLQYVPASLEVTAVRGNSTTWSRSWKGITYDTLCTIVSETKISYSNATTR